MVQFKMKYVGLPVGAPPNQESFLEIIKGIHFPQLKKFHWTTQLFWKVLSGIQGSNGVGYVALNASQIAHQQSLYPGLVFATTWGGSGGGPATFQTESKRTGFPARSFGDGAGVFGLQTYSFSTGALVLGTFTFNTQLVVKYQNVGWYQDPKIPTPTTGDAAAVAPGAIIGASFTITAIVGNIHDSFNPNQYIPPVIFPGGLPDPTIPSGSKGFFNTTITQVMKPLSTAHPNQPFLDNLTPGPV